MKCPVCQSEMVSHSGNHRYQESGLPYVTLQNVMLNKCSKCGEDMVSIPRIAELHRLLAAMVATKPFRLHGYEIRFLRKYLGLSAIHFGSIMGVANETVSRWENGHSMGATAERMLRLMVLRLEPIDNYPTESLADVGKKKAPNKDELLQFSPTSHGWKKMVTGPLHAANG